MRIETSSKRAGELVEHAMADLEAYRRIKQPDKLNRAIAQLDEARQEDPNYLLAVYGRAIADDLRGKAANAIEQLEQVFAENPPFVDDVEYHLGVAHYHRYNWANLDKAIAHLSAVVERTQDRTLECRARVALVQALSMRMIPRDPRMANLNEMQQYFERHTQEAAGAEQLLSTFSESDSATIQELTSVLHNAKGLGFMYWSDFFGSVDEKIVLLKRALEELRLADEQNQNDWAIYCDIASAWMRLGYWRKSHSDIAEAREYLSKVVDHLRPNYGFAVYELGRSHRLCGDFVKAIEYFDRASAIPYEIRDVSDRRLLIERERAEAASKEYP